MEIITVTGVTESKSIKWFKELSDIMLTCETANIADTVKIKVRKQTKSGDLLIVPTLPVNDLAEISAQRRGFYELNRPAFEICDFGNLKLKEGEFFEIDLTGLTSGNTYKLHAIEAVGQSEIPVIYTLVSIPNKTKRYDFVPRPNSLLALPNSAEVTEVTLTTVFDTNVHEDLPSLQYNQRKANDIIAYDSVSATKVPYVGFKNWLTENMNGFTRCEIETAGNGLDYVVVTGLDLAQRFQFE